MPPVIDEEKCTKCGVCVDVCPVDVYYGSGEAEIPTVSYGEDCFFCCSCILECPTDAISMRHFTDFQIMAQIDSILEKDHMQKVVAFACNWCSYAGGDLCGTSRLQYQKSPWSFSVPP